MNLSKLFKAQKALDERIIKEHRLEGEDLLQNKILALVVELAECANEWRGFKYWSKDREPRTKVLSGYENHFFGSPSTILPDLDSPIYKNPLLEEYVDCLHFILSIGNDLCTKPEAAYSVRKNVTRLFLLMHEAVIDLSINIEINNNRGIYCAFDKIWITFVNLGEALGFTWEQIEEAYWNKNKVNHERQNNSY